MAGATIEWLDAENAMKKAGSPPFFFSPPERLRIAFKHVIKARFRRRQGRPALGSSPGGRLIPCGAGASCHRGPGDAFFFVCKAVH